MTDKFEVQDEEALYEERGKPLGSMGSVAAPDTVSMTFREGTDQSMHFIGGGWSGLNDEKYLTDVRAARAATIARLLANQ